MALWTQASAAGSTGSADVVLAASAEAEIRIAETGVFLSPSAADVAAGFVSAEGPSGISVEIRSNSATGAALRVRCSDAPSGGVSDNLFFRTQTPPPPSGTSQTSYLSIRSADQLVWSTGATLPAWTTVRADVQVRALDRYVTAARAGQRMFTSTLTFTVVVQ